MKIKMKTKIFWIMIIVFLSISFLQTVSQEDVEVIDNSVFDNPIRTSALFEHDVHNEDAEIEDCSVCHHVYEDNVLIEDESSEDSMCSDCHLITADEDNLVSLINAFHLRCRNCHFEINTGPVLCGECHVK